MREFLSEHRGYAIAIGGIVLLIILGLIYLFFLKQQQVPGDPSTGSGGFVSAPNSTGSVNTTNTASGEGLPTAGEIPADKILRQLTAVPVSGATFVHDSAAVRYAERSTGHIFDITPTGANRTTVANFTIPRVYETLWADKGNVVVYRYVDTDPLSGFD